MLLSTDNFSTTCLLYCFFFFSFYNKIVVYYKTLKPKSTEKQLLGLALLLILYGTLALVLPPVQWRRWMLYTYSLPVNREAQETGGWRPGLIIH